MAVNLKPYIFKKRTNPTLDAEFAAGTDYGWVRPGQTAVFWRGGLHWYAVALSEVQRIFRRVEPVYGKLCCGGNSSSIAAWYCSSLGALPCQPT